MNSFNFSPKSRTWVRFSLGVLVVVIVVLLCIFRGDGVMKGGVPIIGILQTASHPALDCVREQFVQRVRELWCDQVDFLVFNAEGNVVSAQVMAEDLKCNAAVVGICTIGTLATQVMAHIEDKKPIFMTAVSDPDDLGVVRVDGNVCGTSDAADAELLASVIRELVPQARKVVILHNPSEPNAISVLTRLQEALARHAFVVHKAGVASEGELPLVVEDIMRFTDVIVVPPDNMIAQALPFVVRRAFEERKLLFVFDPLLVMRGVFGAAGGADYASLGRKTAQVAHNVLVDGADPSDIAIQVVSDDCVRVHGATALRCGIAIPDVVAGRRVVVDEGGVL